MLLLAIGAVFAVLYLVFRRRDPRLLRNGVFLTAAVLFGGLGALWVAADESVLAAALLGLLALALPVSVVAFGIALLVNGVTMIRKEGRSLGNRLSLLAGILVLVLPVVAVVLVVRFGVPGLSAAALLFFVSAYASMAFASFAVYSVVYGRMRHALVPAAVVIHGAGLVGGRVSPLLRGRVDRALQAFGREVARGNRPVLVPSGGQGADEPRSEAAAMAEYLREQGVPDADILLEDRSRTTEENIALSAALLREHGRSGPILLVTSDYHVLRTASLARHLDVDAQVVGSRTARYYVPSAFLREMIALLVENKWVSIVALAPFVVLSVGIAVGSLATGWPFSGS